MVRYPGWRGTLSEVFHHPRLEHEITRSRHCDSRCFTVGISLGGFLSGATVGRMSFCRKGKKEKSWGTAKTYFTMTA